MTHGWQAQATYTLARGVDNAPLTGTYVVGSGDDRVSDPSNLDRDKGVTPFNQTHTFAVSTVIAPQVVGQRRRRRDPATTTSSASSCRRTAGCRSTSGRTVDLNSDGVHNDRPNELERNAGRLGTVFYLDLRYSRFIPLRTGQRASCSSRRRTSSTRRTSRA